MHVGGRYFSISALSAGCYCRGQMRTSSHSDSVAADHVPPSSVSSGSTVIATCHTLHTVASSQRSEHVSSWSEMVMSVSTCFLLA